MLRGTTVASEGLKMLGIPGILAYASGFSRHLPVSSRLEDGPACIRPRPDKVDFDEECVQFCNGGKEKSTRPYP